MLSVHKINYLDGRRRHLRDGTQAYRTRVGFRGRRLGQLGPRARPAAAGAFRRGFCGAGGPDGCLLLLVFKLFLLLDILIVHFSLLDLSRVIGFFF